MSTTIKIIPIDTADITFGQVIETSESRINDFLKSVGLNKTVRLKVNLHDNEEKYVNDILLNDKFEWKDNEYVWFEVEGKAGGSDGYCEKLNRGDVDPENTWWRLDDFELNNTIVENIKEKLEKSKSLDRLWYFRRSAGQPGIIALSYGLISASIAELTNGILWSDDGAWDHKLFPCHSSDFLKQYFRSEMATTKNDAEWSRECIESIKEELE